MASHMARTSPVYTGRPLTLKIPAMPHMSWVPGSGRRLFDVIGLAAGGEIEDAVHLAVHDGRRELPEGVQAGVLPQQPARDRECRMLGVAMGAGGVTEAVTRLHQAVHH